MPSPRKRTARMTPVSGSKRRAAIQKRPRAMTLITGGTGFLGSHLVRQLVADGSKDIRVMATSIPDWLVDLGVETFEGSINNTDDTKRAVDGIREVYHLAGKVSRERKDARAMYEVHVEGTRVLCDAAKAAGVKTIVLAFMARKIGAVPTGGVSFVDVRDAATTFRAAMKKGRHGERYLMGAVNWTFPKFFGRLERLTKVSAPRFALPSKIAVTGAQFIDSLFKQWDFASPVEPGAIEMAQHFWYLNCSKAARELGFKPRDPAETLHET